MEARSHCTCWASRAVYSANSPQVLGKSCKMVPVMAGGIVLSGKKYTLVEYAQVPARRAAREGRRGEAGAAQQRIGVAEIPRGAAAVVTTVQLV